MKFGVFYVLECPDGNYSRAYGEMLEQIEYAEELGFDSVWLAEHHFDAYGSMPSPQVAAAAIAQRTRRMQIGLAVAILNFDNPVRTAEDYAMVDVISNGRLIFGAGRGYQPQEFKGLGIPMEHTRERFWECLEIIQGLWANERFSYDGQFYKLENVTLTPRPVQRPHPPIVLAAISPQSFDAAVERGLRFMCTPTLMVMSELKEYILRTRQRLVEKGVQPWTLMNLQMHIAETAEQAVKNVEEDMMWYFDRVLDLVPGARGEAPTTYERYAEVARAFRGNVTIKGLQDAGIVLLSDPQKAIQEIEELQKVGVDHLSCWMRMGGLDHRKVMRSMRTFAKEVLPYFKPSVEQAAD